MSKTTTDLCSIMRAGGSVKVSSSKTTTDLCSIARAGANSGGKLIVSDASKKTTTDLCSIARANPGNVIFELDQ